MKKSLFTRHESITSNIISRCNITQVIQNPLVFNHQIYAKINLANDPTTHIQQQTETERSWNNRKS